MYKNKKVSLLLKCYFCLNHEGHFQTNTLFSKTKTHKNPNYNV